MITKHSLPFTVAVALVSFASPAATMEQWRARAPRWSATSIHSLIELEGCLGSRWAATQHTKYVAMPIEHGMSYTNTGEGQRDILVDVTDDGDHRTIKLWLRNFIGITKGAKEQIEKLSACAGSNAANPPS